MPIARYKGWSHLFHPLILKVINACVHLCVKIPQMKSEGCIKRILVVFLVENNSLVGSWIFKMEFSYCNWSLNSKMHIFLAFLLYFLCLIRQMMGKIDCMEKYVTDCLVSMFLKKEKNLTL